MFGVFQVFLGATFGLRFAFFFSISLAPNF